MNKSFYVFVCIVCAAMGPVLLVEIGNHAVSRSKPIYVPYEPTWEPLAQGDENFVALWNRVASEFPPDMPEAQKRDINTKFYKDVVEPFVLKGGFSPNATRQSWVDRTVGRRVITDTPRFDAALASIKSGRGPDQILALIGLAMTVFGWSFILRTLFGWLSSGYDFVKRVKVESRIKLPITITIQPRKEKERTT